MQQPRRSSTRNAFTKLTKKLDTARIALKSTSKTYQSRLREQEPVEAELQRLRSDLADRDAQVDRLRSQAFDKKQKFFSAVCDRYVIRT